MATVVLSKVESKDKKKRFIDIWDLEQLENIDFRKIERHYWYWHDISVRRDRDRNG